MISFPAQIGRRVEMTLISRRQFSIALGTTAAWPIMARTQQRALPVIGYLDPQPLDVSEEARRAFRQGVKGKRFVDSGNVAVETQFGGHPVGRRQGLVGR